MPKLGFFHTIVGSGNVVSETREARDFDRIRLSGSGEVFVSQTGEESLTIEAEDNILPLLTSEVKNGELKLGVQHGVINLTPHERIRYYITIKALHSLSISGSGKIEISALTTDEFAVSISGSGTLQAPALTAETVAVTISGSGKVVASLLNASGLSVKISGAGNAVLSGRATLQEISIPGAGSIDAAELEGEAARVRVSGAGSATVNVSKSLEATISGMGSIRYVGQPRIARTVSGMGSIRPLNG